MELLVRKNVYFYKFYHILVGVPKVIITYILY